MRSVLKSRATNYGAKTIDNFNPFKGAPRSNSVMGNKLSSRSGLQLQPIDHFKYKDPLSMTFNH